MGCKIANEIWFDVQTFQSFIELQNVSLPIQRELVNMKLNLIVLLTEILEMHVAETKEKNVKNLHKDHIMKTFEKYIEEGEQASETENEWRELLTRLTDDIFANLISCYNLSHKIKQLKGKIYYLFGRTIRLFDELKIEMKANAYVDNEWISVLPLSNWSDKIIEIIKLDSGQNVNEQEKSASKASKPTTSKTQQNTSAELDHEIISQPPDFFNETQTEGIVEINEMISLEKLNKINEQDEVEKLISTVNRYDSQAMECLLQSLNISLSLEDKVYKILILKLKLFFFTIKI